MVESGTPAILWSRSSPVLDVVVRIRTLEVLKLTVFGVKNRLVKSLW